MEAGQRVLVVDGLTETETVLRAVLEPRGFEVDRVRTPSAVHRRREPNVVVLHEDSTAAKPGDWKNVPRVVIGSARGDSPRRCEVDERFLEKPFQYGELIRAIESLLAQAAD